MERLIQDSITPLDTYTEDIILYRGITDEHKDIIELKTITSLTSKYSIASEFGNVMKILIPKGSNAFFISAIDYVNNLEDIENESEFEILILLGTLTKSNDIYIYQHKHTDIDTDIEDVDIY